jgi:hypothetical protein
MRRPRVEPPSVTPRRKILRPRNIGAIVAFVLLLFVSFYASATYLGYHMYSRETVLRSGSIYCNGVAYQESTCSTIQYLSVNFSDSEGSSMVEIRLSFSNSRFPSNATQLYIRSRAAVLGSNLTLASVDMTYNVYAPLDSPDLWPTVSIPANDCDAQPTCPGMHSESGGSVDYAPSLVELKSGRTPLNFADTDLLLNWPGWRLFSPASLVPPNPLGFTLTYVIQLVATDTGSGPFSLAQSYFGNITIPFHTDSSYNVSLGQCTLDEWGEMTRSCPLALDVEAPS